MGDFIELILFGVSIGLGYFFGKTIEKKHYASIKERESQTRLLPVITSKNLVSSQTIANSRLVSGNVAISADAFKLLLAGLRNIFGGGIGAMETLVDRARREAILRMKEQANGADIILNMRIETSMVTQVGSVEVFAYGTAIYYQR